MLKIMFTQLAAYNRWANARLFAAAMDLPDEAYRRPAGVFFGSLHGTLNHLLTADRIWLRRLTGEGDDPRCLDAIVHDKLSDLARARIREDARLEEVVGAYGETDFERIQFYQTTRGQLQEQRIADILQHLFNHQTHHRGQAHACCSILSDEEPPSLDLLIFQRGAPAPDLSSRLA